MIAPFGCIYEGKGEHQALPRLIMRIAIARCPHLSLVCRRGKRIERSGLTSSAEFEAAIEYVCRSTTPPDPVFVVLDGEGDDPVELRDVLIARAKKCRLDRRVSVTIANRKFENWLIAGLLDTGGEAVESIVAAKERIRRDVLGGVSYRETIHQARLVRDMDLNRARSSSPTFEQLARDVEGWVDSL